MLKQFEVENFQAFGAGQVAELAPITLVFGPNSAGKSSLIRALKAVVQSFPASDESYPLTLKGNLVDLGSFKAAAHLHDTARSWRFALTFAAPRGSLAGISNPFVENHRGDTIGVSLEYTRLEEMATLSAIEFRGMAIKDGRCRFLAPRPGSGLQWRGTAPDIDWFLKDVEPFLEEEKKARIIAKYLATGTDAYLQASDDRTEDVEQPTWITRATWTIPWRLRGVDDPFGSLFGSDEPGGSTWLFYPIAIFFESFCQRTTFLAPLRPTPNRSLIPSSQENAPSRRGAEEHVASLLNTNSLLLSQLNAALPRYGFNYQIKIGLHYPNDPLNENEQFFRLIVRDLQRDGVEVLLTDVGVGVSQALPIMVEALMSCTIKSSSEDAPAVRNMLVVEQPEIHLHPRLQSEFTDFLTWTAGIDAAQPLATPMHPIQWLVETHSEAMMLRLQRRIREGRIAPEFVSILYVSPGSSGSTIQRLRLDEGGHFMDDWPDGFFVERIDELFGEVSETE